MLNTLLPNIIRFAGLILLQVLVLDKMHIHQLVHPYIYPLFILLLPFATPGWITLLLGFLLGIFIDIFSDTLGLHAAATVLMAYFRPAVLSIITPNSGYDTDIKPKMGHMGFIWFVTYSAIFVSVHHIAFFMLEVFSLSNFLLMIQRISINIAISIALMLLYEFVFYARRSRI